MSINTSSSRTAKTIYPLASESSIGTTVLYGRKTLTVGNLAEFDFTKVQIALFSAGAEVSAAYVPRATDAGCVVIDNTAHFRNDPDIPLVIPEVNPQALADYRLRNIIANPNCSTIQMLVALKPIYDAVGIERINVATYQAVSGSGRKAITELADQTMALLNGLPAEAEVYPHQIAFNVIPQIDSLQENGYTREEMKMVWETKKILGDDAIAVNPTAVRVPVFYGHAEAIHLETRDKLHAADAKAILRQAAGIVLLDAAGPAGYALPVTHGSNSDAVYVSRVREDISHPRGLDLWVVADNVRKGAALNTVQIAEIMINNYL